MSNLVATLRGESQAHLSHARALADNPNPSIEEVAMIDSLIAKSDHAKARADALDRSDAAAKMTFGHTPSGPLETGVPSIRLNSTLAEEQRLIRALATGLSPSDKIEMTRRANAPQAAGGGSSGAGGGYSIAPAYFSELQIALKQQGSVRAVANNFTTPTGASMLFPLEADTAQSGRMISENTTLALGTDIPFGSAVFTSFTFVSDVLPVSLQLLQDSNFAFESIMLNGLAKRLARAENPYFTTGTGTGQPQGIVTAASLGVVAPTGSTVSVSSDNIVDLVHSVDPIYRLGAAFMMADGTLQQLRKVKDSTGAYILKTFVDPSPAGGPVDRLLGYPVQVNADMPVQAPNARSILFGQMNNFAIRTVVDFRLQNLTERYADLFQVAFIGSIRSDSRLVSAAAPIKYLQNSAA